MIDVEFLVNPQKKKKKPGQTFAYQPIVNIAAVEFPTSIVNATLESNTNFACPHPSLDTVIPRYNSSLNFCNYNPEAVMLSIFAEVGYILGMLHVLAEI
jgi:hypothetical protein